MTADAYVRKIIGIHFDPDSGAPFWLDRARVLGIDARRAIGGLQDLDRLGPMDEAALSTRPILDFVPRSQHAQLAGAVIAETGGTTAAPKRTLFSCREFHAAFVEPFVRVADLAGFPRGELWLWVGPSGPHVIAQGAAACAAALGSPQPFAIDFDPRWFRKLPADSLARRRYLDHLLEQALAILHREPVGVLFTTPVLLEALAGTMTPAQRRRVRGVHYGGMRVPPGLLWSAQAEWFSNAAHLAGYGNSLFGVCMEFGGRPDRPLRYHPLGLRHQLRVDNDGRVWMTRLDPTVLIANLRERDVGGAAGAPGGSHSAFGPGVEDPRPADRPGAEPSDAGIY